MAGVSGGPDIAEAIATNWKAAGVQVDLTPIEGGDLTAKTRQSALSNSMALAGTGIFLSDGATNVMPNRPCRRISSTRSSWLTLRAVRARTLSGSTRMSFSRITSVH